MYGVIGGRPDNGFPVRSWNYRKWSSQRMILWAIVLQWYIFKCLKTNFQNSKSFIWQSHHIANRYIDKSNNFENPIDFVFLQYDFISLFHMWQTRYAICMLYYVINFYIFKHFFKEFHDYEEKSVYVFKIIYLIIIKLLTFLSDLTHFTRKFDKYVKNKKF